ncbi:MAG: DUF3383 domain-containing protein [Caulobacteraceae bacterium]|nr:DUF3383 domain-containing protein [Caulobacteraceae bacterium]
MPAIPASAIVNVNPGVISAGGSALDLSGLLLTDSTRPPIGSVLSFSSALAVAAYFGGSSAEAAQAAIYFNGYDNSTVKPAALLVAQYPTNTRGVAPYVRGGSLATLTLAQLNALPTGTITLTINGVAKTSGTIDLTAVASFSAAATAIQTALAAFDAVTTAAIATTTTLSVTGSISGQILTVTAVGGGSVQNGAILAGTGVTTRTQVQKQLSGTANGVGTYQVSLSQSVASTTITGSYGTMTVSAVASGALAVGQVLSGTGVTAGTVITARLTGTGGTGTYVVSPSQTASSTTISAGPATVAFDSVSSAFVITGGTPGTVGTITQASGALATSLKLTTATGADLSQGAPEGVPSTNMDALIATTQNFASFTTTFAPSLADELAFAAWVNAQDDRYVYVLWDTDPLAITDSALCAGRQIAAAGYSGTMAIYSPTDQYLGAMVMGFIASLDFSRANARATLAFRSQAGMSASVTSSTVADQLIANGYNFYGAYATANDQFVFVYPGSISGSFAWLDSYVNQIWLNNSLQLALMTLLTGTPSIPYNAEGYALIEAAALDPINAALLYGAIRPGVTLSAQQAATINNVAGFDAADVVQSRGWYFLVQDASPSVRAARGSPPCTLWYADGQSVQQITLASLQVQ